MVQAQADLIGNNSNDKDDNNNNTWLFFLFCPKVSFLRFSIGKQSEVKQSTKRCSIAKKSIASQEKGKKLSKAKRMLLIIIIMMIINWYADQKICGAARNSGPRYIVAARNSSYCILSKLVNFEQKSLDCIINWGYSIYIVYCPTFRTKKFGLYNPLS